MPAPAPALEPLARPGSAHEDEGPCCLADDIWGDCCGECGCEDCLPAELVSA